jgi:hypothetical protein
MWNALYCMAERYPHRRFCVKPGPHPPRPWTSRESDHTNRRLVNACVADSRGGLPLRLDQMGVGARSRQNDTPGCRDRARQAPQRRGVAGLTHGRVLDRRTAAIETNG